MAQQTIDPNQLSDIELKAIAYDLMVQGDNINRNLQTINQMIAERAQAGLQASQSTDKTAEESPIVPLPAE